jgi:uncharacterized protein
LAIDVMENAMKPENSRSLDEVLASCSDVFFPAGIGDVAVELNSVGVDGDTPLHVMLWREDTEAALLLIEGGANVNAVGDMSETPLHVAVTQENLDAVKALLKAGADPEAVSEFGDTPRTRALGLGPHFGKYFN